MILARRTSRAIALARHQPAPAARPGRLRGRFGAGEPTAADNASLPAMAFPPVPVVAAIASPIRRYPVQLLRV